MLWLTDSEWREIRDIHHGLVGVAFPPGESGLLLMLRAYLDESGDHPAARVTVMVALLGSPRRWGWLNKAWLKTLRSAGVNGEYKATKCLKGEPPFDHLSQHERDRLRVSLGKIIDRYVPYASVVGVLREDFADEVLAHIDPRPRHFLNDIWTWCGRACLEYIVDTPKRRGERVACVFDGGHASEQTLFAHMRDVCRVHGWESVFPTLTSASSDKVPGLQAADWLVNEIRHDMDHQVFGTAKRYDGFAGMFQRMEINGGILNRESIRELIVPVISATRRRTFEEWAEICASEDAEARREQDAEEEAP